MARPLTVRQPNAHDLRRVHQLLEMPLMAWQRRRAETLLLLAAGHTAHFIAQLLDVHVNTSYRDLQAFHHQGLRCLWPTRRSGAPARLTSAQVQSIWHLAEQPPPTLGLPFACWSLGKLRAYLIRQHIVRALSREHLRRLLKKGGFVVSGLSVKC